MVTKSKSDICAITTARVLTSAECLEIIREKEMKENKKEKRKKESRRREAEKS